MPGLIWRPKPDEELWTARPVVIRYLGQDGGRAVINVVERRDVSASGLAVSSPSEPEPPPDVGGE